MQIPVFKPYPLKLVYPEFDSPLTDLVIELDYLRKKEVTVTSHNETFRQLKHIFHTLESIGSARIEGNNTTIAEYIETKIEEGGQAAPGIQEIINMENTMTFIEEVINEIPVDQTFVSEIHKRIVEGLPVPPNGEGDIYPGKYRQEEVSIRGAVHLPPPPWYVHKYMEELFDFIRLNDPPKYDLLKTAIAHHRFVWIHPFTNGNGRVVRMITYAMLIKHGFRVNIGRIINPSAIFCSDRNLYYQYLSKADSGKEEDVLEWCNYVLKGLKEEIEKVDRLANFSYLSDKILVPAIHYSAKRKFISDLDARMLKVAAEKQKVQASDFKNIFQGKLPQEISRQLKRLREMKMLSCVHENSRKYILKFNNNYLLRGIMYAMDQEGLLPVSYE
jgi:Fic family protein